MKKKLFFFQMAYINFVKFIIFGTVIFGVVGYTGIISADSNQTQIRICRNKQCEQYSEVVSAEELARLSGQKTKEADWIEILSITSGVAIPLILFGWWLINNQQDKKTFEQNVKQDREIELKIDQTVQQQMTVVNEHRQNMMKEFEKINNKIEDISKQISLAQIESLRGFYDHTGKIDVLIVETKEIKALVKRVNEIENYLSVTQQFKIRTNKSVVE